ncbi:MAG: VOC family protein [Myxococcota bacterium]
MARTASRFAVLLPLALGCAGDLESVAAPAPMDAQLTVVEAPADTADEAKPEPEPVPEVAAVDHVGLAVADLEASIGFFVDGLGYSLRGRDPAYPAAFLSNGRSLITLWGVTDPDTAVAFDRKKNVGLHHLALSVTSFEALDALHERLAAMPGVRIEFAPELSYGGPAKHMMVYEPSGNRIELVHRPG